MSQLRILLMDVNRVSLDTAVDMLEYPLGLLYVASALKEYFGDKIDVRIEVYDSKADSLSDVESLFDDYRPEILGLRSLTMGRQPLHSIANLARKKKGIKLIMGGGPHASDNPSDIINNSSFDCAVIGEGERTAVDVINAYLSNSSLENVNGLAIPSPRGIIFTRPRDPEVDLDSLPMPDYDLVDFKGINSGHVDFSFRFNTPHANLFTSRGCPYKCIYCHQVFGKKFRPHSSGRILTEVLNLYENHGITDFQIIDDIFNINRARAMEFYESIIKRNLKLVFSFPNGIRGDLVDSEMVDAMYEAGVRYIAYAIETGSPRIQKLIKKNLKLDKIAEAISLSTARGILTRGFFMIGFPGETEEEANMTVEFAKASDLTLAMFFTVLYFPGTPLYRLAKEISGISEMDLALEDDYVVPREGPYDFSRDTLEEIKLKAIREFFFSDKRLRLSFDIAPNYYNKRDIDASMLVNIISGKITQNDISSPRYAEKLRPYFLIAERFSQKSGFFV